MDGIIGVLTVGKPECGNGAGDCYSESAHSVASAVLLGIALAIGAGWSGG